MYKNLISGKVQVVTDIVHEVSKQIRLNYEIIRKKFPKTQRRGPEMISIEEFRM